jgi:hypothetical protein
MAGSDSGNKPFASKRIEQTGQREMTLDGKKIRDVVGHYNGLPRDRDGRDRQIGTGFGLPRGGARQEKAL